ncbi:sporulation integral membrane protein YlbJ [Dorea sp. 5-2]|nr:sporulation integral membrane protein YlbJ [Dorea sp. 5-2]
MKQILSITFMICLFVCMLLFPQTVFQGASSGLLLWFNTVLPTLLPFIILSNLLIRTGAIDVISRIISPVLCRLFCVSPFGAFAVLTGFLCGCPMGGKVAADLLRERRISEKEGRYLLSFCNNTSPMFIISYIIWQNLNCTAMTLPLLFLTLSAPVLLSFLFRRIYRIPPDICRRVRQESAAPAPVLTALDPCIMDGFETITRIGGYIILFSICTSLIGQIPCQNALFTSVLLPSLELTTGVTMLCQSELAQNARIIYALSLAAFGGWCAAAQTRSMVQDAGFPILPYIIEKLATAMVTSLLIYGYLLLC